MVNVMVGINSVNISIGVTDIAPPKPKPRDPIPTAQNVGDESGGVGANTRIDTLQSGGGAGGRAGPREIQLDDNIVLRISYDDDSGRFVYSGVDKTTGEVVRQFPPEGVLKLLAQHKQEAAGLVLDEET